MQSGPSPYISTVPRPHPARLEVASTALFLGDACVSLCDTVLVLLGDDGPTPIPDDARTRLAALELQVL